jgi:hypothetical protein
MMMTSPTEKKMEILEDQLSGKTIDNIIYNIEYERAKGGSAKRYLRIYFKGGGTLMMAGTFTTFFDE